MFYFTDLVLCVLACLIQTALGQCGCNQMSYGSSRSSCAAYGGAGTGQVGVSGDIGASGQTVVIGSVPVLGSVGFDGCTPVCGSVSISGQCDCDSQEETVLASTASTAALFGRGNAVTAVRNRDQTIGVREQTSLSGQCKSFNTPRVNLITPSNIARSASRVSLSIPTSTCTVNAPSVVSAPSKRLSAPRRASPISTLSGQCTSVSRPSVNLITPRYSARSAPRVSLSTPSCTVNAPSVVSAPSVRLSAPCRPSPFSVSASSCGQYGGAGTGQVGVSGDIGASGQTVVVGSVPVRGAVDFSGCTPTSGTVCISGQCECECD